MRKTPTKKQAAILKYIETFSDEHNISPSYREIQRALKLRSVSAVAEHIDHCVAAGFLQKVPHEARSLRVIPQENYHETVKLFQQKISELKGQLAAAPAAKTPDAAIDANTVAISSEAAQHIHKEIVTLKAAAKILEIDL